MALARALAESCSPVAVDLARVAVARGLVLSELRDVEVRRDLQGSAHVGGVRPEEWHEVRQLLASATEKAAMATSSAGHCGQCGQSVRWVVTVNGKRMPIDPLPTKLGNIELRPQGSQLLAWVHGNHEIPIAALSAYRSHMATCPSRAPRVADRAEVKQIVRLCRVCRKPMNVDLYAAGERTHPCCDPDDRGVAR